MGNLIDDLLQFSRIGRQELTKATINTDSVVKDIINDFKSQAAGTFPVCNISSLEDMHADAGTIKQVWINLISNAIKYSQKKITPEIEIGCIPHDTETVFFVKDNGVGFDEKYGNKLFKVFQRLHSSAEFEGVGVGLAIVEKIISKHGGKVWAEAALDTGACFYFSLPHQQIIKNTFTQ
jgi:light-regulated signal transduction histidine kinase (bacteriophytochrome)